MNRQPSLRAFTPLILGVFVISATFTFGSDVSSAATPSISWLAAGDSYSSGEGLPHSTGPCARADDVDSKDWADTASNVLNSRHLPRQFADPPLLEACTGATSDDMMDANDVAGSPEWVPTMGKFDLVTFTFGGDNIGFSSILEQCIGLSQLVATGETAAAVGAGVPYYVSPLPNDPGHTCPSASLIRARITAFGATYRQFLTRVADKVVAPGGNMVILGYPDLVELPKFWRLWEQKVGSCWGIGTGDATELRGLAGDLNATLGAAVSSINSQTPNGVHLTFVDVNTANDGMPSDDPDLFEPSSGTRHNLCSADPWINGGSVIDYGKGSFHPKQAGLNSEGDLAANAIARLDWSHLKTQSTASSSPRAAPSSPPARSQTTIPGPTLTASSAGGDGFKTSFTLWAPTTGSASSAAAAISSCQIDLSRAVATEMQLHTVATSSLRETVGLSFQIAAISPGYGAFIMDYSNGPQCEQGTSLASVQFTIGPGQDNTFTMWVIYDNAITPNSPLGINDQVALGHWLTQLSLVTIEGEPVDTESLYGTRVVACGSDDSINSYIVAAGELPSTISDGLGDTEQCGFQGSPP